MKNGETYYQTLALLDGTSRQYTSPQKGRNETPPFFF